MTYNSIPSKDDKTTKLQQNNNFLYGVLATILLCFSSSSLFSQAVISSTLFAYLSLAVTVIILLIFKIGLNNLQFRWILFLTVMILLTMIVNLDFDNVKGYIVIIIRIISAAVIIRAVDLKQFKSAVASIIFVICIVSMFLTYFYDYIPLLQRLPVISNAVGLNFSYALFGIRLKSYGFFGLRNYGVFSEPAVFCYFIFIASIFEMNSDRAIKRKTIMIFTYCLAAISTFSPLGIIMGVLLFIVFVIRNLRKALTPAIFFCLFSLAIFLIIPDLKNSLINSWGKLDLSGGNGLGRIQSMQQNLKVFIRSPIFGKGLAGITSISGVMGFNTSTTFSMLSGFGLFFATTCTYLGCKSICVIEKNKSAFVTIIWIILYLLMINNHGLIQCDWFWLLMMIGICGEE